MTMRAAPRSRSRATAAATDGSGPVANADRGCCPVGSVAPARAATSAVRALAASHDDPTATTTHADAGIARRHAGLRQPLAHDRDQAGVLAEHVGLTDAGAGGLDRRRDVDPRVMGAGQQQRHDDGAVAAPASQHVAKIGDVCSQNADRDVEVAAGAART